MLKIELNFGNLGPLVWIPWVSPLPLFHSEGSQQTFHFEQIRGFPAGRPLKALAHIAMISDATPFVSTASILQHSTVPWAGFEPSFSIDIHVPKQCHTLLQRYGDFGDMSATRQSSWLRDSRIGSVWSLSHPLPLSPTQGDIYFQKGHPSSRLPT